MGANILPVLPQQTGAVSAGETRNLASNKKKRFCVGRKFNADKLSKYGLLRRQFREGLDKHVKLGFGSLDCCVPVDKASDRSVHHGARCGQREVLLCTAMLQ